MRYVLLFLSLSVMACSNEDQPTTINDNVEVCYTDVLDEGEELEDVLFSGEFVRINYRWYPAAVVECI